MSYLDIYLVTDKLNVAAEAEVTEAEAQLKIGFPAGYKEYVTTLGTGEYCGYVNVFPPSIIVKNQLQSPLFLAEFSDLWEAGETRLSPELVAGSIVFATSIDGDMAVFHPFDSQTVYILPRNEQIIYKVGSTLDSALAWMYETSGRRRFRYFDSGIGQVSAPVPRRLNISYDEFRNWLVGLGRHTHIEETVSEQGEASAMTVGLLQGGQVQIAKPSEEKHMLAFYKCFFGFVLCYTDMFERLNIEVRYDPTQDDGTAEAILEFLQSRKLP